MNSPFTSLTLMLTFLMLPASTSARNSLKLSCLSTLPCPVFTTTHSRTATETRMTQKITVFTLEFTVPPHPRGCRRAHKLRRAQIPHKFRRHGHGDGFRHSVPAPSCPGTSRTNNTGELPASAAYSAATPNRLVQTTDRPDASTGQ